MTSVLQCLLQAAALGPSGSAPAAVALVLAVKGVLEGGRAPLRPPLATIVLDELAAFLRLAGRACELHPALLPLLLFVCQCAPRPAAQRPGCMGGS